MSQKSQENPKSGTPELAADFTPYFAQTDSEIDTTQRKTPSDTLRERQKIRKGEIDMDEYLRTHTVDGRPDFHGLYNQIIGTILTGPFGKGTKGDKLSEQYHELYTSYQQGRGNYIVQQNEDKYHLKFKNPDCAIRTNDPAAPIYQERIPICFQMFTLELCDERTNQTAMIQLPFFCERDEAQYMDTRCGWFEDDMRMKMFTNSSKDTFYLEFPENPQFNMEIRFVYDFISMYKDKDNVIRKCTLIYNERPVTLKHFEMIFKIWTK